MFENKKTIIICTALLAILSIGAFFLGSWNERRILASLIKNTQEDQQAQVLQDQNGAISKTDDEFANAVESRNIKECEKLTSSEKKVDCKNTIISTQASEKKDPAICGQIQDANAAAICRSGIAFSIATEGNVASCDALSGTFEKNSCVFNAWNAKAIKDKNPAVCDNITEQINRDLCKENVANAA